MIDPPAPQIFVSTFGTGQPLVCLHGIEANGIRYLALAARLRDGVRVVAPDLRGHGRSPKAGPWTLEQHLEDLLPLLRCDADRPVLLGHSYGGLIAWELARAEPSTIAALILVDPAINVSAETARVSQQFEYTSVGHSWPDEAAVFADFSAGRPSTGLWAAAVDAAFAVEREVDGSLRPLVTPDAVRAGWRQMQEPLRDSAWRGPTLVIEAGREEGKFLSTIVLERLRELLGAQLEHVTLNLTHTIPSDYPDELAAAVGPFLARVAAS